MAGHTHRDGREGDHGQRDRKRQAPHDATESQADGSGRAGAPAGAEASHRGSGATDERSRPNAREGGGGGGDSTGDAPLNGGETAGQRSSGLTPSQGGSQGPGDKHVDEEGYNPRRGDAHR